MIQMKHNKVKTPTCERKPVGWTQAMLCRRRLVIKVKVSSLELFPQPRFQVWVMRYSQKLIQPFTKWKLDSLLTINFSEILRK